MDRNCNLYQQDRTEENHRPYWVVHQKSNIRRPEGRGFYSIIADEVTDTFSNQEVRALCVRFLDESQTEPCIREEFFDFLHLKRTTVETTAIKIVEVLTENNIPVDKIRGQAYDGAAAMSSEKVGCQARIKSVNQHALYTHCNGHVLNLSIAHACKIPLVRNMIDGVNATFVFFDVSPKRQRFFEHVLQHHGPKSKRKKLLGLCKTRWVERHTCYDISLACILPSLNVSSPSKTQNLRKTLKMSGRGMRKLKLQPGIVGYSAVVPGFGYIHQRKGCSADSQTTCIKKLQKRDLDVYEARTLITDRIERVKEMREGVDVEFEMWYEDCKRIATVAVPFLGHLSTELNDIIHKDDSVAYAFCCLVVRF
ncbi:52 kDa repressor of the inhibitor of the protein kinase-like [Ylistrum balloti]|uniref:52 kDa repressor of the inhibitor of the protein kinase-like n=1 Tax=Ylistrum balloti TaxID=509963 RepID=UPI0029059AA4|nr:52 kDa repressor of the inhibitor of the protein kinase-like [Ylistrum balloti]